MHGALAPDRLCLYMACCMFVTYVQSTSRPDIPSAHAHCVHSSNQFICRLMTSAGWNDVLESLMVQPPNCNPTYNNQPNGDCGSPLLAITYFTSFIIISYMIVINMYIAIILENFNQAHQEEEIGIVEDDLEMFYIRWSK